MRGLAINPSPRSDAAVRLWQAPAPLRYWHLASLDAPTVAGVWSLAFAWTIHAPMPLWFPLLQGLVVWTVYVADRLLDVRAARMAHRPAALRERHRFHWRHRRMLVPLAGLAGCSAAAIALALTPARTYRGDSLLAAAALAYFSGVHSGSPRPERIPALAKEALVGAIFTAGCALPAFNLAESAQRTQLWLLVSFFAALAFLNCRAIGHWESDRSGSQPAVCAVLLAVCGGLLSCLAPARSAQLLAAGVVAALLLAGLHLIRRRVDPVTLRAAADLVLLTPLCLFCR